MSGCKPAAKKTGGSRHVTTTHASGASAKGGSRHKTTTASSSGKKSSGSRRVSHSGLCG